MSTMYGADVAELRRLASEFRTAADELDRDGGQLTRLLNGVDWIGGVASRFTNQWTGVQLPRIGLSTRFLRDAADELSRNADHQEAASRSSGIGVQGRLPGPGGLGIPGGGWLPSPGGLWENLKIFTGGVDSLMLMLPLFSSPGSLPGWLVDPSDWTAVRMLGTKFQSLIHGGADHVINGRLGGLTTHFHNIHGTSLFKHGADAGKSMGFAAIVGGVDIFLNQREHGWGHADTITAQVDAVLSTAASKVPGGGIVYGGTRLIGDVVYGKVDDIFDITGGAVDGYAERTWGVPADQLTPEQSQQLNERYYGWSGLWNSNYDVARETLEDLGGAIQNVGEGVTNGIGAAVDAGANIGKKIWGIFT